ncbi:MAG: hypothetical protein AAF567_01135 [Actinomycetota bacterium]
MSTEAASGESYDEFVDPVDGQRWLIDGAFLSSNWTCIWDRGCAGLHLDPAPDAQLGCCSVGAQLHDGDEAMRIGALGMTLDPERFQNAATADEGGIYKDETRSHTRVVDGACIFLNRPGFAGGEGCALHLAALDDGEPPMDYKPTICWQAPFQVDTLPDGARRLRPWTREDWHGGAADMGWCCPERTPAPGLATAYVDSTSVADRLGDELRGIVGPEIAVELRARYGSG